jgi:hypothetical protein
MKLFGRWKKGDEETTHISNSSGNNKHKSILIGNKQRLFDDIIGFEDVKAVFEMAIKAERPNKSFESNGIRYINRTKAQSKKDNSTKDMGLCFM